MFGSLTALAGALARMVRELRESQRIAAGAMAVALEDALPGRLSLSGMDRPSQRRCRRSSMRAPWVS